MLTGRERAWRLGLVAAVLIVVGGGWYQAVKIPPYYMFDEQAHVGYVLELEQGSLPTVDTAIDGPRGGEALEAKLAISPERNRDVWVANNPPYPYLPAIPVGMVTDALGVSGGPLLGLRIVNLAFFAASVVVLARLARRLAGDDPTVGLVAAALFAAVPHVGATAGAAFVDGAALLCTVGVIDAVVRTIAAPSRRTVAVLAVWAALATGTRPMTAVVAAVACGVALVLVTVRWWRSRAVAPAPEGPDGDEPSDAAVGPVPPGPVWTAAVLGLPALVLSGWYYARNQSLYGDPTGSQRLFEKFSRTDARTPSDLLISRVWSGPVRTLLNRRIPEDAPGPPLWLWDLTRWAVGVAIVSTVALVVADQVRARRAGTPPRTPLLGWACAGLGAVAVVALTAQHWLGGGNIHPRYLLYPLATVAVAVAVVLVRSRVRWAGVALVAATLALQARQVPEQNRFLLTPTWLPRPPSPLATAIGPAYLRTAGVATAGLGLVVLVVAVLALQPPSWLERAPFWPSSSPGEGDQG